MDHERAEILQWLCMPHCVLLAFWVLASTKMVAMMALGLGSAFLCLYSLLALYSQ